MCFSGVIPFVLKRNKLCKREYLWIERVHAVRVSSQEENLSLVVELDLERLVLCTGVSVSETPSTEAIAYYCELHSLGNRVRID